MYLYFLWYFLFSYMKVNVFLEILMISRNLAFFFKKQLLWNYHPIALLRPLLTLLLIFTSDSIWPEQRKTDFITWLRGNGIGEGEDYTAWSVTKVNKHTSDIFFSFFSPISFHCFMICVLQFLKWNQKPQKKFKKPCNKNNKKAFNCKFNYFHCLLQ